MKRSIARITYIETSFFACLWDTRETFNHSSCNMTERHATIYLSNTMWHFTPVSLSTAHSHIQWSITCCRLTLLYCKKYILTPCLSRLNTAFGAGLWFWKNIDNSDILEYLKHETTVLGNVILKIQIIFLSQMQPAWSYKTFSFSKSTFRWTKYFI